MDTFCVDKYGTDEKVMVAGWEHPLAYKRLNDFNTGARYQMYHALSILVTGILLSWKPQKSLVMANWFFLAGILLFSGSLYLLTFTGIKILGAITPFGGVSLIIGWAALMWGIRGTVQDQAVGE